MIREGVARHVDAGYEEAERQHAKRDSIPMLESKLRRPEWGGKHRVWQRKIS
jgi:hypothetical protein